VPEVDVQALENAASNLGYKVEHRELRACDYGAPTIPKRLYVIARRDGRKIVWPEPTHGPAGNLFLQPYRTSAECIDWSIPCPSIFERKRPLAEATLRLIALGIKRYVIDAREPFIVNMALRGKVEPIDAPISTITLVQDSK
jgi:DNA (cytosine-5)-methyltransferase 1